MQLHNFIEPWFIAFYTLANLGIREISYVMNGGKRIITQVCQLHHCSVCTLAFWEPILQAQNLTTAIHSKRIHCSIDHNSVTI